MDSKELKDLEEKVNRAIELIAGLKNAKNKLEKENESLRGQIEEHRKKLEEYLKSHAADSRSGRKAGSSSPARPGVDIDTIKQRLEKLVGKLAALEDSWS